MLTPPFSVLLIENDPDQAHRIETIISDTMGENASLFRCNTPQQGLEFLEDGECDVVLLSLSPPDSTGVETFREFLKKSPDVPVLVLTSIDDEDIALSTVAFGAYDCLLKNNLTPDILKRSIRYAVKLHSIEKSFRQSEQTMRSQFLGFPLPVTTWRKGDDDFYLMDYNRAAEEASNGNIAEDGGTALSLVYQENPEIIEAVKRCFSSREGVSLKGEYRFNAGGKKQRLDMRFSFIPPDSVQISAIDITGEWQARKAVEESEHRYRTLVESADDGIIVVQDGRIVFCNTSFLNFLGKSAEEVVNTSFLSFIHPDDVDMIVDRYRSRLEGNDEPARYTFRGISGDGRIATVEVRVTVTTWGGNQQSLLCFIRDISNRMAQQDELTALMKAVESSRMGVTITDLSGVIIYTNPADAAMHGWNRRELLGKESRIFGARESWHKMDLDYIRTMKGKIRETVNVRKDGSHFHVRLNSDIVKNDRGEPMFVVCTCEDITERKIHEEEMRNSRENLERLIQERTLELVSANRHLESEIRDRIHTERALRQSQHSYRHLVDNVQDMIFILSMDGTIRFVNRAVTRETGYVEDEILHKNITRFIPPDAREGAGDFKKSVDAIFTDRTVTGPLEMEIIDKSGSPQTLEIQAKISVTDDGSPSILGVARVITQRKQAEKALRASELRLRKMTDVIPDVFWRFTDLEGNITSLTSSFEQISGITPEIHLQQPDLWEHMIHPGDMKAFEKSPSGPPGTRMEREYRIIRPDGESRWISEKSFPIIDDDGNMTEMVEVITDITEQTMARKTRETLISELKEAFKRVNTLSGLIPICSVCKKIRDDAGYWNKLEEYISSHSDAHFTHGICPECSDKLYPDVTSTESRKPK
ncbi:MAG: PAS domain S-box protein [Deltaproteobacteria bacterium]|nr:PAS domain S-box protein [Candidatus Zymogenaceae bacterium]